MVDAEIVCADITRLSHNCIIVAAERYWQNTRELNIMVSLIFQLTLASFLYYFNLISAISLRSMQLPMNCAKEQANLLAEQRKTGASVRLSRAVKSLSERKHTTRKPVFCFELMILTQIMTDKKKTAMFHIRNESVE